MIRINNDVRLNKNFIETIDIDRDEMWIRTSNVTVKITVERRCSESDWKRVRNNRDDAYLRTIWSRMYNHQLEMADKYFHEWSDKICNGSNIDTNVSKDYEDDDVNHTVYFKVNVSRPR